MSREEGLQHIHNLMHVFIEGVAAGIYTDIEDAQEDARQYLAMEQAVEKLSKWNENSSVQDLANIFDGIQRSMEVQKAREKEDEEWRDIQTMPTMNTGEE